MKYFLIAGEASGDLHAASLIEAILRKDPGAEFVFLGGNLMARAAGMEPVVHYRDMAYMGFAEVIRHLGAINRNFKTARKAIDEAAPDCLILIDYPSFNLKMAKFAKHRGIKVFYYIPPKVWAWKQWRVKTIKKVVDRVFAIFPFEVDFYARHGYDVTYGGNPSVEEVDKALRNVMSREIFLSSHGLPDKPLIALLPGSRLGEIRENLKIMTETMRQFPQYRGVVAGAPGVDPAYYAQFTSLPVVHDCTLDLLANARAALVTSGTATLEAALTGIPQVALYQGGGSKTLYNVMKRLLKINYVTLPNLIADRQIIPELLMHLCTPDAAAAELGKILPDRDARRQMIDGYMQMRSILGENAASDTVATEIFRILSENI